MKKTKRFLVYVYIIVSAVSVLIFLDVLYQLVALSVFHLNIATLNHRIIGPLGNPNTLGGFAAITLPLLLYSKSTNEVHEYLKKAAIIFSLLTIFISQSRGAIITAAVVIAIYLFFILKLKWQRLLLIFITIVVSVGTLFIFNRTSIWENRGIIWEPGIKAVLKRPFLGYGQENFQLMIPQERYIIVDNAHNIFLETLVSSGVIGLGVFCFLLFSLFNKLPLTGKIFMMAFLLRAQFNPLSITELAYFWAVTGLLYGTGSKPPFDHG